MHESTFPPLSLLKEVQGSEEVQAVEVIVDAELQQIILRDVEEVLKDRETLGYTTGSHFILKNKANT